MLGWGMPKMFVSRLIRIDAPVEQVYAEVRNFETWPKWSPWLIADPGCKLDIQKDRYSWAGAVCGAGGMAVHEEDQGKSIDYDLVFEKPMRSRAKVRMTFAGKDGATEVTWTMDSKLPFFLFFLRKMMEGFIGMDYERGLLMLKSLVEEGVVPSRLEFPGKEIVPEFHGVGIRMTFPMDIMPETMSNNMERIQKDVPEGLGFSVYYKWDVVKKEVTYFIGMMVDEIPADLPDDLEPITMPSREVYVVRHTGHYRHLGNAWGAGMMHGRSKQFKHSRKLPPFEIYEKHDPENAEVKICLPVG